MYTIVRWNVSDRSYFRSARVAIFERRDSCRMGSSYNVSIEQVDLLYFSSGFFMMLKKQLRKNSYRKKLYYGSNLGKGVPTIGVAIAAASP